jgi:hypothetical protein
MTDEDRAKTIQAMWELSGRLLEDRQLVTMSAGPAVVVVATGRTGEMIQRLLVAVFADPMPLEEALHTQPPGDA